MSDNPIIQLEDVFHHTEFLKVELSKIQLYQNKNVVLHDSLENVVKRLNIIERIIKSYDNKNIKLVHNMVNNAIIKHPEIQIVNLNLIRKEFLPKIDWSMSYRIQHEI